MKKPLSILAIAIFAAATLAQPAIADSRGRAARSIGKAARAGTVAARASRGRTPSI